MLKELTWTYVIEAVSLAGRQQGQKRVIDELFSIFSNLSQNVETGLLSRCSIARG